MPITALLLSDPSRRALRRGVAAAGAALAQSLPAAAAPPPTVPAALAAVVQAAQARGFAGEALVADAADLWLQQAVGRAGPAPAPAHRVGAVWRWGSVSKQVTTTLAMQLVEAGLLTLDDTVAQRLPGFPSPVAAQLTVRQLMQHRSGLPQPDASPAAADGVPAFYRRQGAEVAAEGLAFCAGPATAVPGERFEYNNCDTLVLAALLARVAGQPLPVLLRERLGLRGARLADARERAAARAFDAQGRPVPGVVLATFGAAGALEGTAAELLAFNRALMAGRLVSAAGREQLWAGEPRWGYAALGVWAYPAQPAGCSAPVTVVERRGNVGGIQARNLLVPARGLSLIAFTNAADFDFGEVWQGRGFTHDLLAAALCPAAPAPPVAPPAG